MKSLVNQTKNNLGIKVLLVLFLCAFLLIGCDRENTSNSSGIDVFGLTDETDQAVALVSEANEDLKKIRKMYKENQSRIEELKEAMNAKEIDKVKKIADDLVYIINDGFVLGENAVKKLGQAESLNINPKYKEYLQMKKVSLQKQLDAFEFRRQFAIRLRNEFGTKDKFEIEKVKSEFKDFEENFQTYMEKAREISGEANQLAKEAMKEEN